MQRKKKRLSALRLFSERGKGESSARVIVAQNFNPPLAPSSFPLRWAHFSDPEKGRRIRSCKTGNKEY